jgi:hypothetical protein
LEEGKQKKSGRPSKGDSRTNSGRSEDSWHPWWVWQLLRRNDFYVEAVADFKAAIDANDCPTLRAIYKDIQHHCDLAITADFQVLKRGYVNFDDLQFTSDEPSKVHGKAKNLEGADFPKFHHFQQLFSRIADPLRLTEDERSALSKFDRVYGDVIVFPIDPQLPNLQMGLLHTTFKFRPVIGIEKENLSRHIKLFQINMKFSDDFILKELKKMLTFHRERQFGLLSLDAVSSKKWDELFLQITAYDHSLRGLKAPAIGRLITQEFQKEFANASSQISRWVEQVQRLVDVFNPPTTNPGVSD